MQIIYKNVNDIKPYPNNSIAFIGTMPVSQLIIMVLAQAIFKTVYEIVVYPLTSTVIKKARTLQEV